MMRTLQNFNTSLFLPWILRDQPLISRGPWDLWGGARVLELIFRGIQGTGHSVVVTATSLKWHSAAPLWVEQTELTHFEEFSFLLHFVMGSQQVDRRNPSAGGAKRGKGETKQGLCLECAGCSQGGARCGFRNLGSCIKDCSRRVGAYRWGFVMVAW